MCKTHSMCIKKCISKKKNENAFPQNVELVKVVLLEKVSVTVVFGFSFVKRCDYREKPSFNIFKNLH